MRLLLSPPRQSLSDLTWRYGLAVVAVALAFLLRLALEPVLDDRAPFLLFVLPVLLTAAIVGAGPGLLAALLSIAAGTFAFVAPDFSWTVTKPADLATIALFAANAGASVWLAHRRAAMRAERKRAEAALRDSEALKSAILRSALDCIVTITDGGHVVEWNPAAEQIFGYARAAVLGQPIAELIIPPEYREKHYQGLARYRATGEGPMLGKRLEVEGLRSDGSRFPIELAIMPTHIGEKPHFTAHLRDITERKRADVQLRESAQRLRATYDHAFVGITEVDLHGRFVRVNEHFCAMTGYSRSELLGRSFAAITHPDDRVYAQELFDEQMRGERPVYSHQKRYLHKSGEVLWIEIQASAVKDENGMPLYGIRIIHDISDRKRAEEALQELTATLEQRVEERTQALEQVNQELKAFSYTVSHDLRAPLRAMEGFAAILLDEFGDKLGEDGQRYARRIVDAATRMDDLIQGLLVYSRLASSDLHLQRVELASLVETAVAELRESPEGAAAMITIQPPFPAVRANRIVLGQIVTNLLSNAVKFAPKDRAPVVRVWSEPQGASVRLWVEDNGIGIAPEHQAEIFNVFQRLHGPDAYPGTGIGLAIIRKGAERMGGRSGVISELGQGSRFWVELPKAEDKGSLT